MWAGVPYSEQQQHHVLSDDKGIHQRAQHSSRVEELARDGVALLEEAGADFSKVVKTTILLSDMDDFKTVNEIYGARFPANPPARATFAVKTLPINALVEIDCTAYLD